MASVSTSCLRHVIRLLGICPRQLAPLTALLDETVNDLERGGQVFGGVKDLPDFLDRQGHGRPRAFRGP